MNVCSGDWCIMAQNTNATGEVLGMVSGNFAIDLMGLVVDSPDLLSQGAQTVFNASLGAAVVATTAEFGVNTGISSGNLVASPAIHQAPSIAIKGNSPSLFLFPNAGRVTAIITTMGPQNISDYTNFGNGYENPCKGYISLSG